MNELPGPLAEPSAEWFVNRKEELDVFWKWGSAPPLIMDNIALMGLRRTGKTAILHKIFNRLYNEQDQIIPIYISFAEYLHRPKAINAYEVTKEYFSGFLRSYLAFRYREPDLLAHKRNYETLVEFAQKQADAQALEWIREYQLLLKSKDRRTYAHSLMQWAIYLPTGYARNEQVQLDLFIDEFQVLTYVYNPNNRYHVNLTGSFQQVVETQWARHLVSGSSISMLRGEALGGLLSGRFSPWHLEPLSQEHAIQMALRLGQYLGIPVTDDLALAIWTTTKGYPYSIECLLSSKSPAVQRLPDVDALKEIVFYEITSKKGSLWEHYENEYGKYVRELNGDHTTRKILYWSASHPEQIIYPEEIAKIFKMDVMKVRAALEKLYKTDVIQRHGLTTFTGPTDPLMREFLKYEHVIDVEQIPTEEAEAALRQQLNAWQGEANRQAGHFTEIIVAGVLKQFDDRKVEGEAYFHTTGPVQLPRMNKTYRREGVIKGGNQHEIDVVGEYLLYNGKQENAGKGVWLVSVRYREEKMTVLDIDEFLQHAAALQAEKQYGEVVHWYFSKSGFTAPAIERMKEVGMYYSTRKEFNALAALFGLDALTF